MNQYYFRIPFASSGDILPIPQDAQGDGTVSYTEGFGFDYERNPATDAQAKRIPRDQTNELYRALTDAVGQYQRFSIPEWITSADNNGAPYPYAKGAQVRYDAGVTVKVYGSLVDANTATPGSDPSKWREADVFSLAALVAQAADYATPSSNSLLTSPGRLATALRESRMTYAAASRVAAAYSLALPGATFAQVAGAVVEFTVPDASPAGPLTLKVNALATLPLQTSTESVLAADDLQPNRVYRAYSTGGKWLLLNPVASQLSPAFGLPDRLAATAGAVAALTDLNTALENGWFRAAAGVTNGPAALAAGPLFLEVRATDASNVTQVARAVSGVSEADTRTYQRTRIAGTWGPWYRLLQTATEQGQNAIAPGTIAHTAATTAPTGWLPRNGTVQLRATYPALFAAIGTLYNTGGETGLEFRLPNAIGLFDRGGVPDGVSYADTVGPHNHDIAVRSNANTGEGFVEDADSSGTPRIVYTSTNNPGGETAPKHMLALPIIKF